MTAAILILCVLPFLSSGALYLLRLVAKPAAVPGDRAEKRFLALLLAPIGVGLVVLVAARLLPVHVPLPLPLPVTGDVDGGAADPFVAAHQPLLASGSLWLWLWLWLGPLTTAAYVLVTAVLAARLLIVWARLGLVCTQARPAGEIGRGVHLSEGTSIALAWGRNTILLPQALLRHLTPVQAALVIRHERAHLDRRDPLYFAALAWIDVLLWFNPFIRAQTRRCRLAAELDCDARVTAASPDMRGAYAEALVMALKHAAGNARQCVPAAFSPAKSGDYRMRISEIMHPKGKRSKMGIRLVAAACLLLAPVGVAQLAWSQSPVKVTAVAAAAATATTAPVTFTVMPVNGHLSSGFGMRWNPVTKEKSVHEGVDVSTAIGTPVFAPAAGRIVRADESEVWFGKVIEIDHGGGIRTRYMHLGEFEVKAGDTVTAGQEIAKSGNTGRSTGPHVHIGLFENGKPVDPAGRIPLPKA